MPEKLKNQMKNFASETKFEPVHSPEIIRKKIPIPDVPLGAIKRYLHVVWDDRLNGRSLSKNIRKKTNLIYSRTDEKRNNQIEKTQDRWWRNIIPGQND